MVLHHVSYRSIKLYNCDVIGALVISQTSDISCTYIKILIKIPGGFSFKLALFDTNLKSVTGNTLYNYIKKLSLSL